MPIIARLMLSAAIVTMAFVMQPSDASAQQWRTCKTLHRGMCAVGRADVPRPVTSAQVGGTYPSAQATCNAIRDAREPEELALCIERPVLGCPGLTERTGPQRHAQN